MGKFNLTEGMFDQKLWDEISTIGISGESRQEVQVFRKPSDNYYKKTDKALHEVLMANTKYAIIRKNNVTIDPLGGITDNFSYYLCGVNDEQQYFIRPLFTLPVFADTPKLQQIVDWVNRKDQGFLKRVQGDVLIKFIHKAEIPQLVDENKIKDEFKKTIATQRNPEALFKTSLEPLNPLVQTAPQRGISGGFEIDNPTIGTFSGIQGIQEQFLRLTPTADVIEVGDKKFRRINGTPIKLGNHSLWADSQVYAGETEPMVIVIGKQLILQHPEHKIVEQKIPEQSVAVLTAQRGRDFDLKDYLSKAFD